MNVLIITNHKPIGIALQRYIIYRYQFKSTIINFSILLENGMTSYRTYNLIISEIYNETMVNYGLQYGVLFEQSDKRLLYFFSENTFRNGFLIGDLPLNCFYIPIQLFGFLRSIANASTSENSSKRIMQILQSQPLTSSHH